ncbi:PREDICTED: AT5G14410 [Prunus dulcis]|uniref:PREDICTED: AT5G14410 n=1 Tax=Prunus dulcis TaxID=3755 RepID=A0A5E4ESK7_PRUDU|nr:uncharacterized protein LOC117621158 [Prunus dulcis]KAI5341268.1 hypothetical protein L3X38_020542 [Prunus dulcis]VVA17819.1 PREDICTED: AT5G14410 [Prunus dulcis]
MTTSSSSAKLPAYQRLKHDDDQDGLELDDDFDYGRVRVLARSRSTSWCKFRFRKVHIRRRSFKLKVPSLKRLLFLRRKIRLISALRASCANVLQRFKEGQAHFGDLFAGNYLFLQVNPCSLKSLHKAALPSSYTLAIPTTNIA